MLENGFEKCMLYMFLLRTTFFNVGFLIEKIQHFFDLIFHFPRKFQLTTYHLRSLLPQVRNSLWKYEIHHGLLADPRDASYAPVLYGYLQGDIDARALSQLSARAWVSMGRPVLTLNLRGTARGAPC